MVRKGLKERIARPTRVRFAGGVRGFKLPQFGMPTPHFLWKKAMEGGRVSNPLLQRTSNKIEICENEFERGEKGVKMGRGRC